MIKLDLKLEHKTQKEESYRQDFPDGYVYVCLTNTPRSMRCYVELGADKEGNKYRFFDSKSFYTMEAFDRAKYWITETLIKYEKAFYKK